MRPPNSIKKNLQNESNLVAIAQAIVFFLLFESKMQAQKNWKKKLSVQMPTKKFRNEIIIACLTLHYVIMVCTAIFVNKNFTLGWVIELTLLVGSMMDRLQFVRPFALYAAA